MPKITINTPEKEFNFEMSHATIIPSPGGCLIELFNPSEPDKKLPFSCFDCTIESKKIELEQSGFIVEIKP